ncbi:MAG: hypothetical protein L0Y35_09540 [Flammeovirgaceae bacterium]|nr:hypothetical protein [Flammeovirgaceae bacterium]
MKKAMILTIVILSSAQITTAQEFGLSFSYFLPKNGYFSTPISPFSIRGLGVNLNKVMALEMGVSLYRMSGLNLKDLPFESKDPLIGPNFTIFVPAELVFQFPTKNFQFDIKGGGFFFYAFDNKINYGNFDKAVQTFRSWDVANSDLDFKNHPGFGWHTGLELTVYPSSQFGISLEVNYLMGQAKFPLEGTHTWATISSPATSEQASYPDSKIDFTGLEVSLGVILNSGGGGGSQKKKRR